MKNVEQKNSNGGTVMGEKTYPVTVEQLQGGIELLRPCMDDYLYLYDFKNDYYYISSHALDRFCLPANSFHDVSKTHEKFVHPADLKMLQKDLSEMKEGIKHFHNLQYRWLGLDGQPIWINCRGRTVNDENGNPMCMVGCINEIGAKQKADNVSGLLGEIALQDYLYTTGKVFPEGFILRIGIDDFKDINENLGIEYGDMIIHETANCIARCVKTGQQIYRIVADEFIIVDFLGGNTDEAKKLYKKIRLEIDKYIEKNHYEVVYTISAGLLESKDVADSSFQNLMKLSEFALSEAKRDGKNRCTTFCTEDYEKFLRTKELIRDMRRAVYNDFSGFETYFQPIVDASSSRLIVAETLLRFHSEKIGLVSPVEFIPLLEETGLIIPVGKWVLHQALSVCREVHKYMPDFKISVNVSYIQVMKSPILTEILTSLKEYGLKPEDVIVELTESGFLESNYRCMDLWNRLRKHGVMLALDDFGTGYSNFHYLYDLSPNIIKIDRTFTVRALNNEYEYNLLRHIIEMIRGINLNLCIEGVETEEELESINRLKPDYIQGYYFGKPCPYEQFYEQFVKPEAEKEK